ncbi:MAG TPA: metalloregulator ArsR/SmtB family transcription factor [Anaerolineales bacterium]|nr:metalloregulator ArsR/SmtB family transcription factor [Anaerolineales bacterium]
MEIYQNQAQLFKILMHPTRLAILSELRGGEQCVCHMEAVFGLRQAHISQHLMVLRDAGLVTDRRDGWNIFYQVTRPEIYQVIDAACAFYGASADQPVSASKKAKHACPCPKCNSSALSQELEIPVAPAVDPGA